MKKPVSIGSQEGNEIADLLRAQSIEQAGWHEGEGGIGYSHYIVCRKDQSLGRGLHNQACHRSFGHDTRDHAVITCPNHRHAVIAANLGAWVNQIQEEVI
jgi:hypothetical protein